ncbi:MAG: transcription antitermination factor NusB [Stellaceae bacterium]
MNAADDHTTRDGRQRVGGRRRTVARLAAVQALYQLELNPALDAQAVVREFARYRFDQEIDEIDGDQLAEADPEFFADIVRGVAADQERLDVGISAALVEDWPLARLDAVLRAILRAGAWELAQRPDVPPRVSISEYIAIAHAFFTGKEPGLANGVLDRLGRDLRAAEM